MYIYIYVYMAQAISVQGFGPVYRQGGLDSRLPFFWCSPCRRCSRLEEKKGRQTQTTLAAAEQRTEMAIQRTATHLF